MWLATDLIFTVGPVVAATVAAWVGYRHGLDVGAARAEVEK